MSVKYRPLTVPMRELATRASRERQAFDKGIVWNTGTVRGKTIWRVGVPQWAEEADSVMCFIELPAFAEGTIGPIVSLELIAGGVVSVVQGTPQAGIAPLSKGGRRRGELPKFNGFTDLDEGEWLVVPAKSCLVLGNTKPANVLVGLACPGGFKVDPSILEG